MRAPRVWLLAAHAWLDAEACGWHTDQPDWAAAARSTTLAVRRAVLACSADLPNHTVRGDALATYHADATDDSRSWDHGWCRCATATALTALPTPTTRTLTLLFAAPPATRRIGVKILGISLTQANGGEQRRDAPPSQSFQHRPPRLPPGERFDQRIKSLIIHAVPPRMSLLAPTLPPLDRVHVASKRYPSY